MQQPDLGLFQGRMGQFSRLGQISLERIIGPIKTVTSIYEKIKEI